MAKEQEPTLPGMEHRSIRALEDLAAKFVDLRDQRKAIKINEDAITSKIITLMRRHKKDHYTRDGLEIYIATGTETIKVKMRREEADEEEGATP